MYRYQSQTNAFGKENNWSMFEFKLFGNITSKYYFMTKFLADIIYSQQGLWKITLAVSETEFQ